MNKIFILLTLFISQSILAEDRIVSTVPSLSEIIFELGLSKEVVGVSKYCLFDVNFCNRSKIGTSLDFSYEKILKLKANVVLLSNSSNEVQVSNLKKLKIETIQLKHDRLKDIYHSIETLGNRFNRSSKANELKSLIEASLKLDRTPTKKKILFLISSQIKDGKVVKVQAAGNKNFYSDIIYKMGLVNILSAVELSFPELGREKLLSLDYDYIVEIFGSHNRSLMKEKSVAWEDLLVSTKNKSKYIGLSGDYLFIPGPSIWKIANDIKLSLGNK